MIVCVTHNTLRQLESPPKYRLQGAKMGFPEWPLLVGFAETKRLRKYQGMAQTDRHLRVIKQTLAAAERIGK